MQVRIAAAGFPTRWPFQKFCDRYRILAPLLYDQHQKDWKACTAALIRKIGLEANQYQMGLTKVFLRAGLVALFEELLKRKLDEAAIRIQRRVRGWVRRRVFVRMRRNATAIQCLVRKYLAWQELVERRRRYMAVRMQSHVRAFLLRRQFSRLRRAAVRSQRRVRRRIMVRRLHTLVVDHRKRMEQQQRRDKHVQRLVVRVQVLAVVLHGQAFFA